MAEPEAKRIPSHSESYKGLFQSVFPTLVTELTEDGLNDVQISDGIKHLHKVMKVFRAVYYIEYKTIYL